MGEESEQLAGHMRDESILSRGFAFDGFRSGQRRAAGQIIDLLIRVTSSYSD